MKEFGLIGESLESILISFGSIGLGGDTFNRLYEGFKLYKKYHVPIIVSGDRATSTFSLAKAMKNVLVSIGVDKRYVITEDKSNDTYQNARMF